MVPTLKAHADMTMRTHGTSALFFSVTDVEETHSRVHLRNVPNTQGHKSASLVLLPLSTLLSKGTRAPQMVHQRAAGRRGGRKEWAEAAADDIRMGK